MNFPSFGGHHFSTVIPSIHQFAAKFTPDTVVTSPADVPPPHGNNSKYTANGVPSFTQHHHAAPPSIAGGGNKYAQGGATFPQQQQQLPEDGRLVVGSKRFGFEVHQQGVCNTSQQHQEKQGQKVTAHQPGGARPSATSSDVWPASSGATVADYLSLGLHHFLRCSAEGGKRDAPSTGLSNVSDDLPAAAALGAPPTVDVGQLQGVGVMGGVRRKKRKRSEREKKPKPKPGEIRLTTALDGSTLFCCPECHMAYPEKELLEQHLVGHTLERRFVCDICGAGLKRKDHLTRHKQSHNPDRPFVCSVCLKAFKRKEQLTLHFVIHSGEKRHVCSECGKGFYRKDHLRKHTRSHIARRVKAELSQQGSSQTSHLHVPASTIPNSTDNAGILL